MSTTRTASPTLALIQIPRRLAHVRGTPVNQYVTSLRAYALKGVRPRLPPSDWQYQNRTPEEGGQEEFQVRPQTRISLDSTTNSSFRCRVSKKARKKKTDNGSTDALNLEPVPLHQFARAGPWACRKFLQGLCPGGCGKEHPPICRRFLQDKCKGPCAYTHPNDPAEFEQVLQSLGIKKGETELSPSSTAATGNESEEHDVPVAGGQDAQLAQEGDPKPICWHGVKCIHSGCRFAHPGRDWTY